MDFEPPAHPDMVQKGKDATFGLEEPETVQFEFTKRRVWSEVDLGKGFGIQRMASRFPALPFERDGIDQVIAAILLGITTIEGRS